MARQLLEAGEVDVNATYGRIGDTMLHKCARQNDYGVAYELLKHGANPNIANKYNQYPLDIAMQKGNLYIAEMLKSKGAVTNKSLTLGR